MVKLPTLSLDHGLRVLIVDLKSYPADRQRQECAAFGRGVEFDSFDEWIGMARPTDRLLVASLRVLVPPIKRGPKAKRGQPTRVFSRRLSMAQATGATLVEAASGAHSKDRRKWPAAVEATHNWLRSGSKTPDVARKAGKLGGKKGGAVMKARSAAARWALSPKLLRKYQALWRSGELGNDRAATAAINDMLIDEQQTGLVFGSPETARRVLGKKTN
jgi:hypothetical protein